MTAAFSPISVLLENQRTACEQSVDELDVSVLLESDGINDVVALKHYQVQDVYDLAQQLTQLVPARLESEERVTPHEPVAHLKLACRGLLFAVPGVFYLVVAHTYPTRAAAYTLIASMLAGWGLSQAVSVIAYRILGRSGKRSAAIALRGSLICALVVVALAALIAVYLHSAPVRTMPFTQILPLTIMASAQILYVLAATVLLFHEADLALALSLAPGATAGILFLAHFPVSSEVALASIMVTVGSALGCGWYYATATASSAGAGLTERPKPQDFIASIPFVICGLLSGVTVAYIPIEVLHGRSSTRIHALDLTILPLVLSMGYAEIELLRLREHGNQLMQRCHGMAEYQKGATRLTSIAHLRFLFVLGLVSVAVGFVIDFMTGINTRDLILLSSYCALGTALLAALVLIAFNRVHVAVTGFSITACVIVIGVLLIELMGISITVEGGYLGGCLILLCCMTALAVRTLRDPTALV